jgi:hypothetical protein
MKPPEGTVMVNVDAAFDEDVGCGSVGAIIRDCTDCAPSSRCTDGKSLCLERRFDASATHRV